MSFLQLLALPAHACVLLNWELAGDQDLRRIRADLRDFFAAYQAGRLVDHDDTALRIGLVATELGGNALRHGLPPITVRLLGAGDCFILDVCDHDTQSLPEATGSPEQPRAGGRGLHIVRLLARQLCFYRTEGGKHVWASLDGGRIDRPGPEHVVPAC
jgi:two-component sensor histidine kinase